MLSGWVLWPGCGVAAVCVAMTALSFGESSLRMTYHTLSPHYPQVLWSVGNGVAKLGNLAASIVVGDILGSTGLSAGQDWHQVHLVFAAMLMVAFATFALTFDGKPDQALN